MLILARRLLVGVIVISPLAIARAFGQLAAFPGAVGFASQATGGRGGTVEVVSNLNSSGAGSFANAVSTPGSIVVFTVGGYIDLGGEISVANNVTILGQTAPGGGIGFMDGELSFSSASNDIVSYVRVRQGEGTGVDTGKAAIEMDNANNVIINHSSIQFGQWDSADINSSSNLTIQNSIFSDPIGQQFGIHAQNDTNTTMAYNVFANNHNRNPFIENNGSIQFVNNVVYNVQGGFTSGNGGGSRTEDVVNNYFITGPSTTSNSDAAFYQVDGNDKMYASGNYEDSNENGSLDGSPVSPAGVSAATSPWSPATGLLPTFTASGAYAYDVGFAGDSLAPDSLDALDISQVESLGKVGGTTAKGDFLYTHPYQTGLSNNGYGTIAGGAAVISSANDGIPDTWAEAHGALAWAAANNTTLANKAFATVVDPLGYDEVEDYANQLSDQFVSQTWMASSGNWTTAGNWASSVPAIFQQALIRGTGTANGSVTISTAANVAESMSIGGNGPAAGELVTVTGGGLSIEDTIVVGDQNNGTFTIGGGTVAAANMQLGNTVYNNAGTASVTYIGTLNLSGGTLTLGQLVLGGGTPGKWTSGGVWNWSGGTLQAAAGGLFVRASAILGTGGGLLDTNGATAILSDGLSGSGGLTKLGLGTATFTAANTYIGPTKINAGQLTLGNGSGGGSLGNTAITIASGATFLARASSVAGSGGASLDATAGSILSLADGTVGKFTLNGASTGNALTLTGATLDFDLGSASVDELLVNGGGAAFVNGMDSVDLSLLAGVTSLTPGDFTIIGDSGGGLGTARFSLAAPSLSTGGHTYYFSLQHSTNTAEVLTISPTPVPEPVELAILAVSFGMLMRRRPSRRRGE